MDPELLQFCGLMFLMFAGVIVLAMGAKQAEVYRARNWLVTTGTVTKSEVRSHRDEPNAEGQQFTSVPLVTYQHEAGGEPRRGTRVNFAEKIGGPDVLATLTRYTVGKTVTVYYNPADPSQAVLERDFPPGVWLGAGILILFFLGVILGVPIALSGAAGLLLKVELDSSQVRPVLSSAQGLLMAVKIMSPASTQISRMKQEASTEPP